MTAPMRLFILAGTVGLLLLVVVIGSSLAPAPVKANGGGASTNSAEANSTARTAGTGQVALANTTPDVIMGEPLPASMEAPRPTPLPTTRRARVRAPRRSVSEPALLNRWTVGAGDTLEGIAREALGSSSRWREIVAINPGLSPTALKVGAVLKLPSATASSERQSSRPPASAPRTHVVIANESLSSIAQQYLGSQNDWRRIYNANKVVLKRGPDSLKVGMKLVIPAR